MEEQGKGESGWGACPALHSFTASTAAQLHGGDAAQPSPASDSHKAAVAQQCLNEVGGSLTLSLTVPAPLLLWDPDEGSTSTTPSGS